MTDNFWDGQILKQAFKAAERYLEKRIDELNKLNVFPVPDGDTGINMYLTMQSATAAVAEVQTNSVAEVSAKAARGAIIGARGNSGVLLSQILRGMAKAMEMKEHITGSDFAAALRCGSETAYRAIGKPVEGTILTVIRDVAHAAEERAGRGASLAQTMSAAVSQARQTVKKTPELLPHLKEAGVVDAGGKGLMYILSGMKSCVSATKAGADAAGMAVRRVTKREKLEIYGYDLQFLIMGNNLPLAEIRYKIETMGESVLVVGDGDVIRVHVHTTSPQVILDYAASYGVLSDIIQDSMDDQVNALAKNSNAGTN